MIDQLNQRDCAERVVLVAIPPGFLDDLDEEDQRAITAIVGQPVELVGYDEDGRAELTFPDPFDVHTDEYSSTHTIWVEMEFIKPYRT